MSDRGLQDGRLRPCPNKPNCVCSQDDSTSAAYVEPLKLKPKEDEQQAVERVLKLLETVPRVKIASNEGNYVHAEFRTSLLGFIDDVEFLVDEKQQLVHVRSASRIGYSDFGANRKRIEELREVWARL